MRPVLLLNVAALSPSQIGARTPNLAKLAAGGAQALAVGQTLHWPAWAGESVFVIGLPLAAAP